VAPGARVRAGQLVARMDSSLIEREIAVIEARIRQLGSETRAYSVEIGSGGFATERSFQADAAAALGQLEAARAEHVRQAAELEEVAAELRRVHEYLREGLVRRDRVADLELHHKTLAAAVDGWPARIDGLKQRHASASERLAEWRSKHSATTAPELREARVDPRRQRAAEETEALRVLQTRFANTRLIAPADAEVITLLARPGDVVRPGDPLLLLLGVEQHEVLAYIPERESWIPERGSQVLVRRRTARREEFRSRVLRVADAVTPLPPRFWPAPQLAQWGREVAVELPSGATLQPGEALDVVFLNGGRL
jgi:multidrug resistance efflux pump